jgi:rsbT co-antagonist protein RsbR
MAEAAKSRIGQILQKNEADILTKWLELQLAAVGGRGKIKENELREESRDYLRYFTEAIQTGNNDLGSAAWANVREYLTRVSASRAKLGFSPSETAQFIFSLKQPIFNRMREEFGKDAEALATELWALTLVLDRLGLITTEAYQKAREEVINRQQQELLELSTPVVKLWEGVLALPLIGTLDSARTQVVMESLLQKLVDSGSAIAIIDITGVPTVDTLVAQHLLKTVAAARLMGADCIISGIRPQIAQTIVHLGVELGEVITKSNLSDAFALALQRNSLRVVKVIQATNNNK